MTPNIPMCSQLVWIVVTFFPMSQILVYEWCGAGRARMAIAMASATARSVGGRLCSSISSASRAHASRSCTMASAWVLPTKSINHFGCIRIPRYRTLLRLSIAPMIRSASFRPTLPRKLASARCFGPKTCELSRSSRPLDRRLAA